MNGNFKRQILHLLYPTRCPVCGEIIGANDCFCDKCSKDISRYDDDFSVEGASGFCAAFYYDDTTRPAVMLLKDGICGNSAFALAKALTDSLRESGIAAKCSMIVPVPIHKSKRAKRGYNQAELIAAEIGKELRLPVCTDAIVKMRKTSDQKKLGAKDRRVNLDGAFDAVKPERICGKRVLLLDDVCTTGSTLAELTALLLKSGAEAVYCASCCKTPSENEKKKLKRD